MGYDADMRMVRDRFNKWGETAIVGNDEFAAADSLIQRHYDDRARVFEDLVNTLKRDTDIQSPWDNLCDKGLELNERLAYGVESKINDGFRGMKLGDFSEGEKIAWGECKRGKIGLIAEAMIDIMKNDVEIYKKLEEDLKKCSQEAAVVDELARATFNEMREKIRDAAVEAAAGVAALPVDLIPWLGSKLAPKVEELVKSLLGGTGRVRELAQKKAAAKAILLANNDLVEKAQAQIGDRAIEDIRKRAEEIARSWKDATRSDYHVDWESFGNACCEVLRDKAARAAEQANKLYNDMRPLYLAALKNSFVSILSDASSLDSFTSQLSNDTQKMFEDLAKESEHLNRLKDNDTKRTAVADMAQIISEMNQALAKLKEQIASENDALKKN